MTPAKVNPTSRTRTRRPTPEPAARRRPTRVAASAPLPARPAFGRARIGILARIASAAPLVVVAAGVALAASGALSVVGVALGAVLAACGVALLLGDLHYASTARLIAGLHARPADPTAEARLVNLTESLCFGFGLPVPSVVVVDDSAPNALALGRNAHSATLVVTTGALATLDRMQLEAILAHELAHVKRGDTAAAAVVTRAFGLVAAHSVIGSRLAERGVAGDREARADLAATSVTRYPPALADALEALASAATVRPTALSPVVARLTAWQWCAPFALRSATRSRSGELDLALRIAALREL